MKNYIRYQIQERKYSSNVIIGIWIHTKQDGKEEEKSEIILMPALFKNDGDVLAKDVCEWLNQQFELFYKDKK